MLSQIITGGLSLSLVATACERVETTVGHSGGSALGGRESVSRDSGGGGGVGGCVCGRSETGLLWPWQQLLINHPGIPKPHGPLPDWPYGWSCAIAIIAKGNTASKRAQPT